MPKIEGLDEEVRRLSEQGLSIREVATHLHVTHRTVSRARARLGIAHRVNTPVTDAERRRIESLIREGYCASQIGQIIGRSGQHVGRLYPESRATKQQKAEIASLSMRLTKLQWKRRGVIA